jgi:hypothetical protein
MIIKGIMIFEVSTCSRGKGSGWTEKKALILNVPRRVEHSKCAMLRAAFLLYLEPEPLTR